MAEKYEMDGYIFRNGKDYERAKKEKETIAYLSANTDLTDMKAVYQIYKRSVDKGSFQTIFGLNYLEDLRKRLLGSGTVTEDLLDPIPVGKIVSTVPGQPMTVEERKFKELQEAYEKAQGGKIIKNFLIAVLLVIVGVMLFTSYQSQYSIFTFFSDYKEEMRGEIVDEYESWERELEEREASLEKREKELEQQDS